MTWPQYLRREVAVRGTLYRLDAIETEIMALLLLRRGSRTNAQQLIGMIWPDCDQEIEAPEQSVYSAIFRLRRRFPGLMPMVGGYMIPLPAQERLEA